MSAEDKKSKNTAPRKEPAAETKAAGPKSETGKSETVKADAGKTEAGKSESVKSESGNAEAAPARKGMGEGQKPVSQAYKDNWNEIFGKKKKR